MLSPGHIAGGYLVAYSLIKITQPQFLQGELDQLMWYGMFFAFAPDLDMFFAFLKQGTCKIQEKYNHRKFYSHMPLVWLFAGVAVMAFSQNLFGLYIGLLVWLASWIHFLFDSLQYGIMWLFPFSKRLFSVKDTCLKIEITEKRFFPYWRAFLKNYATRFRLTFLCEIGVICIALIIFFFV